MTTAEMTAGTPAGSGVPTGLRLTGPAGLVGAPAVEAAACAGTDPEAFFSTDPDVVAWCVRVCSGCPIATECLRRAWARDEQWGVWGGRLFRPRMVTCRPLLILGRWRVVGRDVFGVEVYRGSFDTREEAAARCVEVLADSQVRRSRAHRLRRPSRRRSVEAGRRSAA